MKVFLSGLMVFFLGSSVLTSATMAQSADLFPELKGRANQPERRMQVESDQSQRQFDAVSEQQFENKKENVIESRDELTQKSKPTKKGAGLFPDLNKAYDNQANQQGNDEEELSGKIRLVIDDVKSVIPAADNFAYCQGKINLENETNRKLNNLVVSFTFGEGNIRLAYANVDKKGKQNQSLTMAGKICHSLLSAPKMEIIECSMDKVSEEECKKKVEFIPIP